MAHVGQWFPRLMMPDKGVLNTPVNSPPYRMRLITTNFSNGSQTVPWRNLDLISEPPTWGTPINGIEYIFLNPVSIFLDIRVTWTLINTPTITADPFNLRVEMLIRFFDSGVVLATETASLSDTDMALGVNRLYYQFTTFTTSVNRSIVDKMDDARYCAARWSDVPSYTPRKLH
jgi:hypothetical protein